MSEEKSSWASHKEASPNTTSWHSYPKIFNLGHAAIAEIFLDEVVIEEKIDGSQFSFGKINGQLRIRSKGVEINPAEPPKMFEKGVEYVKSIESRLVDGYTYRGEYLEKPKHNTLAYDRIPKNHIIIFDINHGHESYFNPVDKRWQADRLGLETVPLVFHGRVSGVQNFLSFMETISCLGGQKVEGLVVKNYHRFGIDKKVLLGKYVSEAFKEVHNKDWGERNPGQTDFFTMLGNKYRSEARWNKAIQHLKERGQLTNTPADIGPLLKEISGDTMDECHEEIKEAVFQWAMRTLRRQLSLGFPEWYKTKLLARSEFSLPTGVIQYMTPITQSTETGDGTFATSVAGPTDTTSSLSPREASGTSESKSIQPLSQDTLTMEHFLKTVEIAKGAA